MASQVLVNTLEQELPVVVVLSRFTVVPAGHASVAVGAVNDGVAVHSIVALAPWPPIVGGVVSTIFTSRVQGALLQPFNVVTKVSVKEVQALLAITVTVWLVEEPEMVPPPVIVH